MMTRGIRNNNPGNIRIGKTRWAGQKDMQSDPDFIEFTDPAHGVRALMKILVTYQQKYKLENIQSIINRWAPPVENDTGAYVTDVAKRVGVRPMDYLSIEIPENLIRMAQAIVHHENGKCPDPTLPWWYPDETYETAAALALGHEVPHHTF